MQPKRFANTSIAPCSCDWVQDRLFGYLDGELPLPERERFQAHTEACPACTREVQNARRAELALRQAISAIPAAGDLRAGFYSKLAQSETKPRVSRRWNWALVAPAFAACAIAVVMLRPTATVPNSGEYNEPLSVRNSTAALPFTSEKKDIAASIVNESVVNDAAPPPTVAKSALPRGESLRLEQVTLPIRLTKQEIRRASKSAIVRADVPTRASYYAAPSVFARDADAEGLSLDSRNRFAESDDRLSSKTRSLGIAPVFRSKLSSEGPTKLREEVHRGLAAETATGYNEQPQNVMRVASIEQTETDGESYLEVDDDTRNFSFSTRLASSQANGEEGIELSVSGDDVPEESTDGTDSE